MQQHMCAGTCCVCTAHTPGWSIPVAGCCTTSCAEQVVPLKERCGSRFVFRQVLPAGSCLEWSISRSLEGSLLCDLSGSP